MQAYPSGYPGVLQLSNGYVPDVPAQGGHREKTPGRIKLSGLQE